MKVTLTAYINRTYLQGIYVYLAEDTSCMIPTVDVCSVHTMYTWGTFISVPGLRLSFNLTLADNGFSTVYVSSTVCV